MYTEFSFTSLFTTLSSISKADSFRLHLTSLIAYCWVIDLYAEHFEQFWIFEMILVLFSFQSFITLPLLLTVWCIIY